MNSVTDTTIKVVGFPIRKFRDQRSLASPPDLSQRATSFIASRRQGIHQMPLITSSPPHTSDRPVPGRLKADQARSSW
jgi:hypothetical protein